MIKLLYIHSHRNTAYSQDGLAIIWKTENITRKFVFWLVFARALALSWAYLRVIALDPH